MKESIEGEYMKKKRGLLVVIACIMMVLSACSGSKKIQGEWQVQDGEGKNSKIIIREKELEIDGQKFDYVQNATGFENGVSYCGIKQNGKAYSIIFPDKDKDIAVMIIPNSTDEYLQGNMIYAMNRKIQPNFKEYVEKYIH